MAFLCTPNNPTGMAEDRATVERSWPGATAGLVVVDEAYGEFAGWSALELVADDGPWSSRGPTPRRGPWPLAARVPDRAGRGGGEAGAGRPPYHLAPSPRRPGWLALATTPTMWTSGSAFWWPSGSGWRRRWPAARSPCSRRGRTSSCSASSAEGHGSGSGSSTGRAGPRLRPSPRLAAVSGSLSGPRRRTNAPRRSGELARGGRMSRPPRATRSRSTKETGVDLVLVVDGCGATTVTTGIPFFDHMVEQLGKHGGFDLTVKRRRFAVDLTTPSKTSGSSSARVPGRPGRQGRGSPFRVDRRPPRRGVVQVALDLSGAPLPRLRVDPGVSEPGSAALRPPAGRGVLAGVRQRRRDHPPSGYVSGRNGHQILEASFKGVARSLRDAVTVEGSRVPSTKGTLA